MTTLSRYFLSSVVGKTGILDLRLSAAEILLSEQQATVVGSTQVDWVYAGVGTSVDFTNSGAGVDQLYLDGRLADYTLSVTGSVLTLSRTVGVHNYTYKINTSEDKVVFANGSVAAIDLANNASTPSGVVLNTAETSAALPPSESVNKSQDTLVTMSSGGVLSAAAGGPQLVIQGTTGVESVYVRSGAAVDARNLGGGIDKIYLNGKWADYTKTITSNTITLSREVGGFTERVVVSASTGAGNDQLYFADGSIQSQAARSALSSSLSVSLKGAGGLVNTSADNKTPLVLASASIVDISVDSGSSETDFITKQAVQTVTGTFTGQLAAGDKIQVRVGTGAWQDVSVSGVTASGGNFSAAGVNLAEGANALQVRTLSANGNTRTGTGQSVTLDTGMPEGNLSMAVGQDNFVNSTETSITLRVTDMSKLKVGDKLRLKMGGANLDAVPEVEVTESMKSAGVSFTVPKSTLSEGLNTFTLLGTDTAGNTITSSQLQVTLDTEVPTPNLSVSDVNSNGIAISGLAADAYLNAQEKSVLIKVGLANADTTKSLKADDTLQLKLGGNHLGASHTVTSDDVTRGYVLFTVNKSDLGASAADGAYQFTVQATDAAGNQSTSSQLQVTLDTGVPTPNLSVSDVNSSDMPITGLAADAYLNAQEKSVLIKVGLANADATQSVKVDDTLQLKLGGNHLGGSHTITSDDVTRGYVLFTVNKSDLGASAADGEYQLSVQATDVSGNQSTSHLSLTLDTVAPAAILSVSDTQADGSAFPEGTHNDDILALNESTVTLKMQANSSVTGGAFKTGDVLTLQHQNADGTWSDVKKLDGAGHETDALYTTTVGQDGAMAYLQVITTDLAAGHSQLRVRTVDLAGNTGESSSLNVTRVVNFSFGVPEVTALDVDEQMVLTAQSVAGEPSSLVAQSGSKIRLVHTTDPTHTQEIDVNDTRFVTISGNKIIIKPPFDFDLGATYRVEVDANAFTATVAGVANTSNRAMVQADALGFGTVNIDSATSKATAAQGQVIADDGTVSNGKKWIKGTGLGDWSNNVDAALDLSGGDYAVVVKDGGSSGARADLGDGVAINNGFNLSLSNMGNGDRIYVDDVTNDKTALNNRDFTQISDGTSGGFDIYFNPAANNDGKGSKIHVVSGEGMDLSADNIRDRINVSNSRLGTHITAIERTGAAASQDFGGDLTANTTFDVQVSAAFRVGDSVQLMRLNANGQEVAWGDAVTVSPQDISAGHASISHSSLSDLNQGRNTIYAKVTSADGAVTKGPILFDAQGGFDYDTTAPAPVLSVAAAEDELTTSDSEDGQLTDGEDTVLIHVNGWTLGDTLQLKLGAANLGTAITITENMMDSNGEIHVRVSKSSLGEAGAKSITATLTDRAGNVGETAAALNLDVKAYVQLSGSLHAGPVVEGNDLVVTAYDLQGHILGQDTSVSAGSGAYNLKILSSYTGPVLIKVSSTGAGLDYRDERTGQGTNLDANAIYAVVNAAGGGNVTANVTPLTDLAAKKLMTASMQLIANVNHEDVTNANHVVAQLFLGQDADITQQSVTPTINADGTNNSSSANLYGQVLAQISHQATGGKTFADVQADLTAGVHWIKGEAPASASLDLQTAATQVRVLSKVQYNVQNSAHAKLDITLEDLTNLGISGVQGLSAVRQQSLLSAIKNLSSLDDVTSVNKLQTFVQAELDKPMAILAVDTGTSNNDSITNDGHFNVTGLSSNTVSWEYSSNGGSNWQAGSGSSFLLGAGAYEAGVIRVRQAGVSGSTGNLTKVVIDTSGPTVAPGYQSMIDSSQPASTGGQLLLSDSKLFQIETPQLKFDVNDTNTITIKYTKPDGTVLSFTFTDKTTYDTVALFQAAFSTAFNASALAPFFVAGADGASATRSLRIYVQAKDGAQIDGSAVNIVGTMPLAADTTKTLTTALNDGAETLIKSFQGMAKGAQPDGVQDNRLTFEFAGGIAKVQVDTFSKWAAAFHTGSGGTATDTTLFGADPTYKTSANYITSNGGAGRFLYLTLDPLDSNRVLKADILLGQTAVKSTLLGGHFQFGLGDQAVTFNLPNQFTNPAAGITDSTPEFVFSLNGTDAAVNDQLVLYKQVGSAKTEIGRHTLTTEDIGNKQAKIGVSEELAKGSYTFAVALVDVAGNRAERTEVITLAVDYNEAPTATSSAIAATEDTNRVFTAADFGFSDGADGDVLSAVIITATPTAGTLKYRDSDNTWKDVMPNQHINKAQIDAGALVFKAAQNAHGNNYSTIKFKVQDSGGTSGAGQDTSGEYTLTLNVESVNDAPSGVMAPQVTSITIGGLKKVDGTDSLANGTYQRVSQADVTLLSFDPGYNPTGGNSAPDTTKPVYKHTDSNGAVWYAWARQGSGYHISKLSGTSEWFWESSNSKTFANTPLAVESMSNNWMLSDASAAQVLAGGSSSNVYPQNAATVVEWATGASVAVDTTSWGDADGLGNDLIYRWQQSLDGITNWIDIPNTNSARYTLADGLIGRHLRVQISYTDGDGTAETFTSQTTQVTDTRAPRLDLTGDAQGSDNVTNVNTNGEGVYLSQKPSVAESSSINKIELVFNAEAVALTAGERLSFAGMSFNLDGTELPGQFTISGVDWTATYDSVRHALIFTAAGAGTSAANIQSMCATMQYVNISVPSGARVLSISVYDSSGNKSNTAQTTITYDQAAPVLDLDGSTSGTGFKATTLNSAVLAQAVTPLSNAAQPATLSDASYLSSVQVSVSGVSDAALEQLTVNGHALNANGTSLPATVSDGVNTWSVTYSNSVFTFTQTAGFFSADNAQTLLRVLGYKDTAPAPTDGVRLFDISATDRHGNASEAVRAKVVINTASPNAASSNPIVTADGNGDGVKGDVFTLTFSEAVKVSDVTNLSGTWAAASVTALGNATIVALNAITVDDVQYASAFKFTKGSSSNYTTGTVLTVNANTLTDTGGSKNTAAIAFTMPDIVAPGVAQVPQTVANDNIISSTEGSNGATVQFGFSASTDNEKIHYYMNGLEIANSVQTLGAGATSATLTLNTSNLGADASKAISTRLEDAAGNLGAFSDAKIVAYDSSVNNNVSVVLNTDAGTVGTFGSSDTVTLQFGEAVSLTQAMLPSTLGTTKPTPTAVDPYTLNGTVYATKWTVTLGAGSTLAAGGTISLTGVKDKAGNSGTFDVTVPTDIVNGGRPTVDYIKTVSSDNVVNSSEANAGVNVSMVLKNAANGDVVSLFRDGEVVKTITLGAGNFTGGTATVSMSAADWGGSDGMRGLTAQVNRGSSYTSSLSDVRTVSVAADQAHWSTLIGTKGLWFDPDAVDQTAGSFVTSMTAVNQSVTLSKTAGNGPRLIRSAINGHSVLSFDATGALATSVSGLTATGAQQKSVFAVYQSADLNFASSEKGVYFVGGNTASSTNSALTGSAQHYLYSTIAGFSYNGVGTGVNITASANVAIQTQFDNTTTYSYTYLNGAGYAPNTQRGIDFSVGKLVLGSAQSNGTTSMNGFVMDLIIVDNATLTKATVGEINTYLAEKYRTVGATVKTANLLAAADSQATGINISLQVYDLSARNDTALVDQYYVNSTSSANDAVLVSGADYVNTGAGADTIYIKDLAFRQIDGGTGSDQLVLTANYTGTNNVVLADFVSNARGTSSTDTASNTRVNNAGWHKLYGFEQIDLSRSAAKQTLTVDAADVNQLSETNTLGVVLGDNDVLNTSGFSSANPTWGYYTVSGQTYTQKYVDGTGKYTLYAIGGDTQPKVSAASYSGQTLTLNFDESMTANTALLEWTVAGGAGSITGLTQSGADNRTLSFTMNSITVNSTVKLTYTGTVLTDTDGKALRYKDIWVANGANDVLDASLVSTGAALFGNGGNDSLQGGAGSDLLVGGQGNDTLFGGGGADIFAFIKGELSQDTIADFDKAQGDKLDLSRLLQGAGMDKSSLVSVSKYLQLSSSGNAAVLKINVSGTGDFEFADQTITLTNGWASGGMNEDLLTLLSNRVILA